MSDAFSFYMWFGAYTLFKERCTLAYERRWSWHIYQETLLLLYAQGV